MLDKIKQYRKIILITGMAILLIAAGIVSFVLLTGEKLDFEFANFIDNYEKKEASYVSKDENVNFDGTLDDTAWKNQRWLEVEHATDSTIQVKMTSYFGEDGLYMAFDVNDLGVYYNRSKLAALNSGIELYLSPMSGAENIEGVGYEIDLNAGGKVAIKKCDDEGNYTTCPGKVYLASQPKGELNTAECKGYTLEVFIDYGMLGDDRDSVYANPAIIRSFSEEGEERQWYGFGFELYGASWTRADTWWSFDKNGLVAYDATLKESENGKLDGKKYVVHGDDYTFEVIPNDGYYANSVMVNNKNYTEELFYQNGKTYCTVENVEEHLNITATYIRIPEDTMSITGKISDGKETVSGVAAWAVKNGYSKMLDVDANGNFSDSIPAIDGLSIFSEADGYVSELILANKDTVNIVMSKPCFGNNENVKRSSDDMEFWDMNRLYEDRIRLKNAGVSRQLINSEIYSNSIYASSNLVMKEIKGVDTRAGFSFYDDAGNSVFVSLTLGGEAKQKNKQFALGLELITYVDGEYTWSFGGILDSFENQDALIEKAASDEGIPVAVHYCNGAFDIWVNGQQYGYSLYPMNKEGQNVLKSNTKMAVGLECWQSKVTYKALKFDGNYPERSKENVVGWDLSKRNQGIVRSLTNAPWTYAMLTTDYSDRICVSANVPIPLEAGKDLRAGFYFSNKSGDDVFISLTKCGKTSQYNPNGKQYYLVEVISQNYGSWAYYGTITDISTWGDVKSAASSSTGVPMTVYVENGKFTVGVNGYIVAENVYPIDKDGKNIFAEDTALAAGLATAEAKVDFTKITLGTTEPDLQRVIEPNWDLSKISKGEVKLKEKQDNAVAMLWPELRDSYYVTSKIVLPAAEDHVRSGYRFEDEDGNTVFVCLTCVGEDKYVIEMIHTTTDGSVTWPWGTDVLGDMYGVSEGDTTGIPFAVSYNDGKFNVWVNNILVGSDIVSNAGGFTSEAKVSTGLECWNVAGKYYELEAYDKRE